MIDDSYAFSMDQMAKGLALPSLVSKYSPHAVSSEEKEIVKTAAGSMYAAGADTTVSSVTTFFLAMCLHPEIQRKAQAEIDSVIGSKRLPSVADRPSLPYVEAVMKEVFRWLPVAPLGVPHCIAQNDSYKGLDMPSGATVISNIWAMTRDPKYFPDPEVFRPERFCTDELDGFSIFADPLYIVFGFGRRVCPGQRLAEPSVFLAITMTLATFNIEKARDPQTGNLIEPSLDIIPGGITQLEPFPCKITPRSQRAVDLITRSK